ncbi:MAG: J domain-containing protein [Candidatus Polarisedimenticolia bacterium]
MANPYQILRVQRTATPAQIDDAYYRMRRLVSYGEGIKEDAINLAYAILSDPQRRARIDEALERRNPHPQAMAQHGGAPRGAQAGGRRSGSWLQKILPFF